MNTGDSSKKIMSDPALRRKYADFISSRRNEGNRRQMPGQDNARAQQGVAAQQGQRYVRPEARSRADVGTRLQEYYRNRGTEQGGTGKPSTPTVATYSASRRY